MKIALVNTVCKFGSTGRFAYGIHCEAQKRKIDSLLIFGRGKKNKEESNLMKINNSFETYMHVLVTRLFGLQGFGSIIATRRAIKKLESFKPDMMVLMNLHGYYLNYKLLYEWILNNNIPCIQLLYDEHAFVGRCCFAGDCDKFKNYCDGNECCKKYPKSLLWSKAYKTWKIKKAFYDKANISFLGSPYVVKRAKESALLAKKNVEILDEGVDIKGVFFPHSVKELRHRLGIDSSSKVILNVAPYSDPRKGVKYFFELAKKFVDKEGYVFVQVGFDGNKATCPPNMITVSYITDLRELSDYYCLADIFVCTSFDETVPNTCIEALGCGTHVCGFNISGIPYSAKEPFGKFVAPGSVKGLERIIIEEKRKTKKSIERTHQYAIQKYDMTLYYEGFFDSVDRLFEGNNQ